MADSLFDIFGDHLTRQAVKNVSRQPLSNIENMGKKVSTGPIKPNEPMKKLGESKKSFLSNTGKALQSTPSRQVFTPRAKNVNSVIYTDDNGDGNKSFSYEEIEFTRPSYRYDNYQRDLFDYLTLPKLETSMEASPPNTPPPIIRRPSMELLECSYQDEFFTDDFSNISIPIEEDGLPELF